MIHADIHTHTLYSHGKDKPAALYEAALAQGLTLLGFSEHSPRPAGFDYTNEYREHLTRHLPDYVREVGELKAAPREGKNGLCRVLFGMEMDWLHGAEDFTRNACRAYDFDYLLGSVHFIGHWGYDDNTQKDWAGFSQEECEKRYLAYFSAWEAMLRSGLFNIAAHPDLIKIFSVEQFHVWLVKPESRALLKRALTALRDAGMSMEISSAGLRKTCREMYPAPLIMQLAAELNLRVSVSSDAHCAEDVAFGFARLGSYAQAFGFKEYVVFEQGRTTAFPL